MSYHYSSENKIKRRKVSNSNSNKDPIKTDVVKYKKEIKIGVALEDRNSPLEIVFENLSDTKKEKKTKVINI